MLKCGFEFVQFFSLKTGFIAAIIFTTINALAADIVTVNDYKNSTPILVPKSYPDITEVKELDWAKYNKALQLLTQENYGCVVKQASKIYGVDPVAIMGSIIGEHSYNVNMWDTWGERYVFMRNRWVSRFEANDLSLTELLNEDAYNACKIKYSTNYDTWDCYNRVWAKDERNIKKSNSLKWTFFNPFGSGYTYGLGQLGPERALMVTDIVSEKSGFDLLTVHDVGTIYDHILNPKYSIHYVAANNLVAINIYKNMANFDVSENPGVIATLYNLGKEKFRANQKYNENLKSLKAGEGIIFPSTNHFGTLINFKQDEIRGAYERKVAPLSDTLCKKHLPQ